MVPLLISLLPTLPGTETPVAINIGDGAEGALWGLGGIAWRPALSKRPQITQELLSTNNDGSVEAGSASFTIALAQIPDVTDAHLLTWVGRPCTIYDARDLNYSTKITAFKGTVQSATPDRDLQHIAISAQVDTTLIQKPLLTAQFEGSGGSDGDPGFEGTVKPAGFGVCKNIQPIWFDATNNVGMIDGYGNTISIDWLGEGLSTFGPRVADYPSYAALVAAITSKAIAPGQWGTCVAEGMVGLGAPAVGIITVHATFGTNRPGALMKRVLEAPYAGVSEDLIDAAAFALLDANVPKPVHYHTAEQRQVDDLLKAIAASCVASPMVTLDGRVSVTQGYLSDPVATLDLSGAASPRVLTYVPADPLLPYYLCSGRTARPASVLTNDQVNYGTALTPRGRYSADNTYSNGDIVDLADGSSWLYINATPSKGHAPPVGHISDDWWFQQSPPTDINDLAGVAELVARIDAAEAAAEAASEAIEALSDDGVLSITEKVTVLIPQEASLEASYATIDAVADAFGISAERTAAATARTAWLNYLASLSPAWNDVTQPTPVDRNVFRSTLEAYDTALKNLQKTVTTRASQTSNWTGVTDDDPTDHPKPSDGATVGAPTGTAVGTKLAEDVVDAVDNVLPEQIIEQALRQDDAQQVLDARTFVDGQPVNAVFETFRNEQTTTNSAVESKLDLLGAKSPDGSAWLIDLDTVRTGPDQTLGQKFEEVGVSNGDVSAQVDFLTEAVIGPDGDAEARGVLRVEADGSVGGLALTATGEKTSLVFAVNQLALADPGNGGARLPVFDYENGAFVFFVPVIVQNKDIADGAATGTGQAVGGVVTIGTDYTTVETLTYAPMNGGNPTTWTISGTLRMPSDVPTGTYLSARLLRGDGSSAFSGAVPAGSGGPGHDWLFSYQLTESIQAGAQTYSFQMMRSAAGGGDCQIFAPTITIRETRK